MGKRALLIKLLQDLRASYWFIPSALTILALVLAQGTLWLDRHHDLMPFQLPDSMRDTQVEGARTMMTIISQSVFGVAGVMFSMTMVAVSFASGNFGPRLVGNFMRDRGNQWSLGLLIATFVFALSITSAIQSETQMDDAVQSVSFVPHLSIAIAMLLTLVSVFTVIYFVHHIPELINVSNITAIVGARLIASIKQVCEDHTSDAPAVRIPDSDPDTVLTAGCDGYIQTLDLPRLTAIAKELDLVMDVPCPVGEFVTEHSEILRIWGPSPSLFKQDHMRDCFAFGTSPNEAQNLMFLVDQLVEMLARALSPGVNDPFTAINCLNWFHAAAVAGAHHSDGLKGRTGGPVRVMSIHYRELLEASFGASASYVREDQLCLRHLRQLFIRLEDEIGDTGYHKTLRSFVKSLDL